MTHLARIKTLPHLCARGFTLLEVLITIVVMALGLLGMAGLQIAGLRTSNAALQRTHAMQLAQDITERIRANVSVAHMYADFSSTAATEPATGTDCSKVICTPEQIAANDMRQWYLETRDTDIPRLSGGAVTITPTADDDLRIEISWQEGTSPHVYTLRFHP